MKKLILLLLALSQSVYASIPLSSNFLLGSSLPLDGRTVVTDNTARDAIPSGQRYEGLTVYSVGSHTNYQLQGGILNADWVAAGGGGGTLSATLTLGNNATLQDALNFDGIAIGDPSLSVIASFITGKLTLDTDNSAGFSGFIMNQWGPGFPFLIAQNWGGSGGSVPANTNTPGAVGNGPLLMLGAAGYDGSGFTSDILDANIEIDASPTGSNFTPTDHGTAFRLSLTTLGTTSHFDALDISSGGAYFGEPIRVFGNTDIDNGGKLRFLEGGGSNQYSIGAPSIGSSITLTLPSFLPGSTQCLTVDTSGNMGTFDCESGGASPILQNGNSFGSDMIIGTNDNYPIQVKINNNDILNITTDHQFMFNTVNPSSVEGDTGFWPLALSATFENNSWSPASPSAGTVFFTHNQYGTGYSYLGAGLVNLYNLDPNNLGVELSGEQMGMKNKIWTSSPVTADLVVGMDNEVDFGSGSTIRTAMGEKVSITHDNGYELDQAIGLQVGWIYADGHYAGTNVAATGIDVAHNFTIEAYAGTLTQAAFGIYIGNNFRVDGSGASSIIPLYVDSDHPSYFNNPVRFNGSSQYGSPDLNLGQASTPSNISEGSIWMDSSTHSLRMQETSLIVSPTVQIVSQTTDNQIVNTTLVASLLGTFTGPGVLKANTMKVGKTLKLAAGGVVTTTGTPSVDIKFKVGSTMSLDFGNIEIDNAAVPIPWHINIECNIRPNSDPSFHYACSGTLAFYGKTPYVVVTTGTLDNSVDDYVDLTAQWDTADPANSITGVTGMVELGSP